MGAQVAAKMLPDGTKVLAPSAATVVGQEFVRDPVALGQVAQPLLDVLSTKQHTSAEYAYLRQTTRTNNAAVVAEGAAKRTSVYRAGPGSGDPVRERCPAAVAPPVRWPGVQGGGGQARPVAPTPAPHHPGQHGRGGVLLAREIVGVPANFA